MTNVHPLPSPKKEPRRHRPRTGMGLFVTDQELAEYLGVPYDTVRPVLAELDRDTRQGFPKKIGIWGGRRYLPAVQAWLDSRYGTIIGLPQRRPSNE